MFEISDICEKVDSLCEEMRMEKPVDFKEVRSVLNEVYGGSQNIDSAESVFPMQQKVLLCSLMLILNESKNTNVNISMVISLYNYLLKNIKKSDALFYI